MERAPWRLFAVHALLALAAWAVLVAAAALAYAFFYAIYVPAERHTAVLHLQYPECDAPRHTPLSGTAVLHSGSSGVAYDISLVLELPDDPTLSLRTGNVMVAADILPGVPDNAALSLVRRNGSPGALAMPSTPEIESIFAKDAQRILSSRQATLLPYEVPLVAAARTFLSLPFHVLGLSSHTRLHRVFLAREMALEADARRRNASWLAVRVALSGPQPAAVLPVASARVEMVAHFTGLRYAMFYWRWATFAAYILVCCAISALLVAAFALYSLYMRLSVDSADADWSSDAGSLWSVSNTESHDSISNLPHEDGGNAHSDGELSHKSDASRSRRRPVSRPPPYNPSHRQTHVARSFDSHGVRKRRATAQCAQRGCTISHAQACVTEDEHVFVTTSDLARGSVYAPAGSPHDNDPLSEGLGVMDDPEDAPQHMALSPQTTVATVDSTDDVFLPDPDIEGAVFDGHFPVYNDETQ